MTAHKKCKNCSKLVNISTNSGHIHGCDYVYGRRGWRQKQNKLKYEKQ